MILFANKSIYENKLDFEHFFTVFLNESSLRIHFEKKNCKFYMEINLFIIF